MSCFFCGSDFHFSQFCDKFNSDISRLTAVRSKKVCCKCFKPIDLIKPVISNHDRICSIFQRCYNCYSPEHHTFLCNKPASQLFIPKIDVNLLQRFIQTFEPIEQFQFAFYPHYGNIGINGIQILNQPIDRYQNITFHPTSTILYNYHTFSSENGRVFLDKLQLNNNNIFVTSRIITLKNLNLTGEEFLSLLSLHTIELTCSFVTVTTKVKLSEILMITRNIEKLDLQETNIIVETFWPEILLENLKGIRSLRITINDLFFNAEVLEKFLKKSLHAQLFLDIEIPTCYFEEIYEAVKEKFKPYFPRIKNPNCQTRVICIRFIERNEDMSKTLHLIGYFTLQ